MTTKVVTQEFEHGNFAKKITIERMADFGNCSAAFRIVGADSGGKTSEALSTVGAPVFMLNEDTMIKLRDAITELYPVEAQPEQPTVSANGEVAKVEGYTKTGDLAVVWWTARSPRQGNGTQRPFDFAIVEAGEAVRYAFAKGQELGKADASAKHTIGVFSFVVVEMAIAKRVLAQMVSSDGNASA